MDTIPYKDLMEYKMVILVRKDVEMSKGKVAGQVAHACVGRVMETPAGDKDILNWYNEGQRKVVLKVENLEELTKFCELADSKGIRLTLVADAGRTEIESGTVTCAAFGPFRDNECDIFNNLKLL